MYKVPGLCKVFLVWWGHPASSVGFQKQNLFNLATLGCLLMHRLSFEPKCHINLPVVHMCSLSIFCRFLSMTLQGSQTTSQQRSPKTYLTFIDCLWSPIIFACISPWTYGGVLASCWGVHSVSKHGPQAWHILDIGISVCSYTLPCWRLKLSLLQMTSYNSFALCWLWWVYWWSAQSWVRLLQDAHLVLPLAVLYPEHGCTSVQIINQGKSPSVKLVPKRSNQTCYWHNGRLKNKKMSLMHQKRVSGVVSHAL